jgi:hypothetical protein
MRQVQFFGHSEDEAGNPCRGVESVRGSGAMIRVGRLVTAPSIDAGGVTLIVLGRAAVAPGGLGRSAGPVSSRRDSLNGQAQGSNGERA